MSLSHTFDRILISSLSDVTKDTSEMMQNTVEKCKKIVGKARNYGEWFPKLTSCLKTTIGLYK